MVLNSSTVSSSELATSQQYNDLRLDVVSTSSGHVHDGTLGIGSTQFILNVAGAPLLLQNTTDAVSNEALRIAGGNRACPTDNDEVTIDAYLDDDCGAQTFFGSITHKGLDLTPASKDSRWEFQQYTADTLREVVVPPITADDTFAMVTLAQTFASKTLTTPTISSTGFANANHAHAASNSGGVLTALGTIATGVWCGTTITVPNGGTGATTLTDGGLLLGSGVGAITAMGVLADGSIVVGDGTTDPVALAAFTSSTGQLLHERGGTEADLSAVALGGLIKGSGAGSMALLGIGSAAQVLTVNCCCDFAWAATGGVTLSGSTNNNIATVTGANALVGETTLTYNGTNTLTLAPACGTAACLTLVTLGACDLVTLKLKIAASAGENTKVAFIQGDGSGSANNMSYEMGYTGAGAYWFVNTKDSNGSSADADVIRIPDAGVDINGNGVFNDTQFDYVCTRCGKVSGEMFECCGQVEWHDDVNLMALAVRKEPAGLERMAQFKLVTLHPDEEPSNRLFMSMNRMPWFLMSGMIQNRERMDNQYSTHEQEIDRLRDRVAQLEATTHG